MTDKSITSSRLIAVQKRIFTYASTIASRLQPILRPLLAMLGTLIISVVLIQSGHVSPSGFKVACELFVVFLWLVYLTALARGRLRDGLIIACSLVFGIAALEALTVKSEKTSFPVVGKGFYAIKPGVGWGASDPGAYPARKSDPQTGKVIYDVTYTIDKSLLRETISNRDGVTIAFFGDSFTFGEGVNDAETMPQAFADLTGRRLHVLNLGFPGYGPHQALRALETGAFDEALGSHVKLIVLMTAPWHAERTACKPSYALRGPRYHFHDSQIEYVGPCSEGLGLLLREWIQGTALYRAAIEPYAQRVNHDDVELYIRVVLADVELARTKYGAATLIPYLPVGNDYLQWSGFTDESIVERFQNGGATVIDASLAKERGEGAPIEIQGDGHPTAFAHLARARLIQSSIAREMPELLAR